MEGLGRTRRDPLNARRCFQITMMKRQEQHQRRACQIVGPLASHAHARLLLWDLGTDDVLVERFPGLYVELTTGPDFTIGQHPNEFKTVAARVEQAEISDTRLV